MVNSQKLVKKFMLARGWNKQLPDHVAKSIAIESAELLELFQWGSPSINELKADHEIMANLKGELADVLIYCIQMSLLLNLNCDEIVKNKLIFANKKYPARVMKRRSNGDSMATKQYLEIKKNYRLNKNKS